MSISVLREEEEEGDEIKKTQYKPRARLAAAAGATTFETMTFHVEG